MRREKIQDRIGIGTRIGIEVEHSDDRIPELG
jgi:hypothetical protein